MASLTSIKLKKRAAVASIIQSSEELTALLGIEAVELPKPNNRVGAGDPQFIEACTLEVLSQHLERVVAAIKLQAPAATKKRKSPLSGSEA